MSVQSFKKPLRVRREFRISRSRTVGGKRRRLGHHRFAGMRVQDELGWLKGLKTFFKIEIWGKIAI